MSKQSLDTPIQYVKGVGPSLARYINKLEIFTIYDFLYYFPRSYDDRRNLPKISQVKLFEVQTIIGSIQSVSIEKKSKMQIIKAIIKDASGMIQAIWFNQNFLKKNLKIGKLILLKGKIEKNLFSQIPQIIVSEYELINLQEDSFLSIGKIVPIYALTSGLTQLKLRKIAREIIDKYLPLVIDPLPNLLRQKLKLLDLSTAISNLHFPLSSDQYKLARTRLVFDEFFYLQLLVLKKRYLNMTNLSGLKLQTNGDLISKYLKNLPYQLTNAQKNAIKDIAKDVTSTKAMNRLLQGDVGSGKTDVAIISLLFACQSGKKGAIMAPTEILATQHYLKMQKYLAELNIPIFLLKGKIKGKKRSQIKQEILSSKPMIIIGTHALLEEDIVIPDLAMIIIDEQHRFGVIQRKILEKKSFNPHCLYMTATPIPRSLSLTCFGDLFKSVINELPPGRIPPKTYVIKESELKKVLKFCQNQLSQNQQIYVVYPLIEESEKLDLKSAIQGWENLTKIFPKYNVGLLHGRQKPSEKERIMQKFKNNEIHILVSTTVIEVGIDVPNATTMIIQHADRFGLSQLHQLRGRIGRGKKNSYCFLVTAPKNDNAKKRINAMLTTSDGFQIAEYDLQIRGPGDLLGTRQAGLPEFNLANLIKDENILILARKIASNIIDSDPHLLKPEHNLLRQALLKQKSFWLKERLN